MTSEQAQARQSRSDHLDEILNTEDLMAYFEGKSDPTRALVVALVLTVAELVEQGYESAHASNSFELWRRSDPTIAVADRLLWFAGNMHFNEGTRRYESAETSS